MPPDEYVPEGPYEFAVGGMLRADPPRIEASPYVGQGMAYYMPAYHTVITNVVDYGNAAAVVTYTGTAPVPLNPEYRITFDSVKWWDAPTDDPYWSKDVGEMEDVDICLPR